jgi:glycosyltransferase involved in cell wall biosynthesis
MNIRSTPRICLVPRMSGVGGMVSFQHKLAAGLQARQVEVGYDLADEPYQAVLVIGGTRDLPGLWRARRKGIPVVQRLDGMNWLHRLGGRPRTGWRHFLRSEYGNVMLNLIRSRLATCIVYQSQFVRSWWQRVHLAASVPSTVIYNGVDLQTYTPLGPERPPDDRWRLLLVEGSLMGGYEQGLEAAAKLARLLATEYHSRLERPIELMVVGRVSEAVKQRWESNLAAVSNLSLVWAGLAAREQIPALDRAAHLFYSSDVNAACPNSVIEALACGLPVTAFDTGALPELVTGDAGRIAPYGGDPWQLDPPDVDGLALGGVEILLDQARFHAGARRRAEDAFGLERMVDAYLEVLLG